MIRIDNLVFSYPKGASALQGISATFNPGVTLLLGENGAGKTTLLELLAGLLVARFGSVEINGLNVATRTPEVMQQVMYLGNETLFPAANINDMALRHAPFFPTFSPDLLEANLRAFGIAANEPFDSMSMGTRRKAQLAYALALQLPVLLLDEPANGLDIPSKQQLARMIAANITPEQTIIISTHTVSDLEAVFDNLAVISHGSMVLQTEIADLADMFVFVTSSSPVSEALFQQLYAGAYHAIVLPDNQEWNGAETRPDISLFYNALMSRERDCLLGAVEAYRINNQSNPLT